MKYSKYNNQMIDFIKKSPTPFHAVSNIAHLLSSKGFVCLKENEAWQLKRGEGYYVIRNDSSIIAFIIGENDPIKTGIRFVGAHTDSPCIKIKPSPEIFKNSYYQLGTEIYGGVLLSTWFDRDLSIAGKVIFKTSKNKLHEALVDIRKPVAIIPSLAIHLDENANKGHTINPEKEILPILFECKDYGENFREILAAELINQSPSLADSGNLIIIDYDLSFYDAQAPAIVGLKGDFISGARLDNLLSCFAGTQAMIQSNRAITSIFACYDHEEVGSTSAIGANSVFMESILNRLFEKNETQSRVLANSMFVSTDNAHGIHPNFPDKHDKKHAPILNHGLVIKVNANQRYATNFLTSSIIKNLCDDIDIPTQYFSNRADISCGSTIGPMSAANIGIKTIDIGVPTFAMHSIRETAGAKDAFYLSKMLKNFFDVKELS